MTFAQKIIDFTTLQSVTDDVKNTLQIYLRKEKKAMLELIQLNDGEDIMIDGKSYSVQVMLVGCSTGGKVAINKKTDSGMQWMGFLNDIGESISFSDSEYQFAADGGDVKLAVCKQWLI